MVDVFLNDLLMTPGTSGGEPGVQEVVRAFARTFADQVTTDVHGNVMATVNPEGRPTILLDAHCDQIGLIVRHIDSSGFLRVSPVGGWDIQILLGQRVVVHTANGMLPGVIARKPIHLLDPEERKTVPKIKDLLVDIGAGTESETRELVQIGDFITPEPCFRELRNGRLAGVAMDDRTGIWVVMNALKMIAERRPTAKVVAVSTVQEEIGARGAVTSSFSVCPDVALAVDVTHATDCPGIDQNEFGRIEIGKGPVIVRGANANPGVVQVLREAAAEHRIPVQINAIAGPASNDGAVIQISRGGCAMGLVTIPNRYMHSPVELIAESDLQNACRLIAEFCLLINTQSDFIPAGL